MDIKDYLNYLVEQNKKPSTISRTIASIRAFYQYETKNKRILPLIYYEWKNLDTTEKTA